MRIGKLKNEKRARMKGEIEGEDGVIGSFECMNEVLISCVVGRSIGR